jgi:hypothetical protein
MRGYVVRLISIVLAGSVLLHPGSADAWYYDAGVSASWFELSERDAGDELVAEEGPLVNVTAGGWITPGDWRLGAYGGFIGGVLDYDGQTQGGTPFATETEWRGWHAGAGVERRLFVPVPGRIGVGLEFEQRWRDILPDDTVAGLNENYQTVWLSITGSAKPTAVTGIEFQAGCAVASRVQVSFADRFDDAAVNLSDHCRAGVGFSLQIGRIGDRLVYVRPFADWERYDTSGPERLTVAGSGVGTIYLPETEFTTYGITIGIRGERGRER